MKRRPFTTLTSRLMAIGLVCLGAVVAQAFTACNPSANVSLPEFAPRPRRPELPLVSVLAPEAIPVLPLLSTLRSELAADFDVHVIALRRGLSTSQLAGELELEQPKAVVLVDNSAAQLYAPIANAARHPLPSIIVMSSFVERLQSRVPNSTAIAFETPAVTTLSEVRSILGRPIARAGVVYREGFEAFIARERELARREEIELVALPLPNEPSVASLGRVLRRLEREHLDAMWISNDNVLLSKRLLAEAWLPFAKKTALPIVVGVPALVQSSLPFGTYAAVPDTVGLGVQTADLIYTLQKSNWHPTVPVVQPPLAVKTYLNVARARELGAPPENDKRVDVLLEASP